MSGDYELWFGRLVDPDTAPTTVAQCLDIYANARKKICNEDVTTQERLDATQALFIYYVALKTTPGMSKFLERWFVSRAMGNNCPTDKVLFLARESGCYATAMPSATAEENKMLTDYDQRLARALENMPFSVVCAGLLLAYVLPLAGLESQFARRIHEQLAEMPSNDARRVELGMPNEWEFESAEIADMTRISVGEAMQQKEKDEE